MTEVIEPEPGEMESLSLEEIPEDAITTLEQIVDLFKIDCSLTQQIIADQEGDIYDDEAKLQECQVTLHGGLHYRGTFKDGKMHGRGTLTWPDKTQYSGDFFHNEITGTGFYTWPDGSTYEGEVNNTLRHGYGTFKSLDKTYCGRWLNGKRKGKGLIYYDTSRESYYDGEWENDVQCGYGTRRYKNGNMYKGEFAQNKRHGHGTMQWNNLAQEFTGEWRDGVITGSGTYVWYLKRVPGSQYPLRNTYEGKFLNNQRHGRGTFYYASGALYEGEWCQDKKHGHGRFVFKNGCVFKGEFCEDHMIDHPGLILAGMSTPDIVQANISLTSRSCTPSNSLMELDIEDVLSEHKLDLEEREIQLKAVMNTILRYSTQLKQIYKRYSIKQSHDNTCIMNHLQFCRFLKDYHLHHHHVNLSRMSTCVGHNLNQHNGKLFTKDFLCCLVKISNLIYNNQEEENDEGATKRTVSKCFDDLIGGVIERIHAPIQGGVYDTHTHANLTLIYVDKCNDLYHHFLTQFSPCKKSLTLRQIALLMHQLDLFHDQLSPTSLVQLVMQQEHDQLDWNMDREVCFLDFFETLISCASLYAKKSDKVPNQISITTSCEDDNISQLNASSEKVAKSNSRLLQQPRQQQQPTQQRRKKLSREQSQTSMLRSIKSRERATKNHDPAAAGGKKLNAYSSTHLVSRQSQSQISQRHSQTQRRLSQHTVKAQEQEPSKEYVGSEIITENKSEQRSKEASVVVAETSCTSEDSVETWSNNITHFFENVVFPAFRKRRLIDEIIAVKSTEQAIVA